MSETFNGIEIEYLEDLDRWRFVLRGYERSAKTLAKAKAMIAKPNRSEETFLPAKAYIASEFMSREHFKEVEVLYIADKGRSRDTVCVLIDGKKKRVWTSELFEVSAENDAVFAEYAALMNKMRSIDKKSDKVWDRVKRFRIEP
jgi:hypothetical protein